MLVLPPISIWERKWICRPGGWYNHVNILISERRRRVDILEEIERANRLRWDSSRRGRYEVYYATFNHLASCRGFWIRYTLNAPKNRNDSPYAQVWFSSFNHSEPARNFGLRRKYPIDSLRTDQDPFMLWLDGCEMSSGTLKGHIEDSEHEIRWDLSYTCADPVHLHLPRFLYKYPIADTTVLCPAPDASFEGKIRLDGERIVFDGDPGCQTHIWGKKHAHRWAWGHCNAFENSPDTVFEGLSVQVRRAGVALPALNFLYFRHAGREYRFTELPSSLHTRSEFETGRWTFSAQSGDTLISGQISCAYGDIIRADYTDPDGEPSYCHNTETARAEITISTRNGKLGRWEQSETLVSPCAAHVEFASRTKDPRVEKKILDAPLPK